MIGKGDMLKQEVECPCCGVVLVATVSYDEVKLEAKEKDWRKQLEQQMVSDQTESDLNRCKDCANQHYKDEDPICRDCIQTITHEYTRHLNFKPK